MGLRGPRIKENKETDLTSNIGRRPKPTSVGDTSVGDTSVGDTSVGDTSVGDTSVGDTSVGDTSVGDTSVGDTSVGDAGGGVGDAPLQIYSPFSAYFHRFDPCSCTPSVPKRKITFVQAPKSF
ncbi:hypothetical protein HanPSC8_Chr14g0635111 [Helianthus annuus]|nr:hypothetical protein HanPSC8_Chr14g0635111 [Helianthus annuus]